MGRLATHSGILRKIFARRPDDTFTVKIRVLARNFELRTMPRFFDVDPAQARAIWDADTDTEEDNVQLFEWTTKFVEISIVLLADNSAIQNFAPFSRQASPN